MTDNKLNSKLLIRKVSKTIDEHSLLNNGESVLLAVSGGSDSVCMLDVFIKLSKTRGFVIEVAHINHSLRDSDSDADQEFVRKICNENSILLHDKIFNVKEFALTNGLGIEEAARIIRYGYFSEITKERNIKVAVAHHQQDQVETVLHNLIRGCGIDGLSGIKYQNENIIRPMLDCSKSEIMNYLGQNQISYCHDYTNDELCADRNKIRIDLVPYIDKLFSRNITQSILKTIDLCKTDTEFIEERSKQISNELIKYDSYNQPYLSCLEKPIPHPSMFSRAIRDLYALVKGNKLNISHVHTHKIIDLFANSKELSRVDLPGSLCAVVIDSKLYIKEKITVENIIAQNIDANNMTKNIEIPFILGENVYIKEINANIISKLVENRGEVVYNSMVGYFPTKDLDGAIWRFRMPGDYIIPNNGSGKKTIKKFLNEKKVPPKSRQLLLFLAKDSRILWIPELCVTGISEN